MALLDAEMSGQGIELERQTRVAIQTVNWPSLLDRLRTNETSYRSSRSRP